MSQYAKAIVAAVVGALATVISVVQAAITDGEITSEEWQLIATTAVGAIIAVIGVYAKANTPTVPPPPPPPTLPVG